MTLLRSAILTVLSLALGGCAPRRACVPASPAPPPAGDPSRLERYEYRRIEMGVETRIVLYAPDEATAVSAARAAFERIAELDSLMSDYRSDSELTRLSARAGGPPVRVSEDLFAVLSLAQEMARLSGGAFDVTAGPIVVLWRGARRTGELPDPAELRAALARSGWRNLRLDSAARTARLLVPGMRLDLGGIAKGYAAQEAIETLRAHGVGRALVVMGGDMVASGAPPGQDGWRVRVASAPPDDPPVELANAALSSSGDTEPFVVIGGVRYSHVVDPRTGQALRSHAAATVRAPDGATADALSTLLTVLEPDRGRALLARRFPCVRAVIRTVAPGKRPPP
jgi:thiamine biosynthesis lipoprotein